MEHCGYKQDNPQRPDLSPEIAPPRAVFGPLKASVPIGPSMLGPMIEELDTPEERPSVDTTSKGKRILEVPVRMTAHAVVIPETTQKEMDEILKIIRKSDVVEQLGQTPSKISMLALLICSEAHAKALIKFLKATHVAQETSTD